MSFWQIFWLIFQKIWFQSLVKNWLIEQDFGKISKKNGKKFSQNGKFGLVAPVKQDFFPWPSQIYYHSGDVQIIQVIIAELEKKKKKKLTHRPISEFSSVDNQTIFFMA